MSLRVGPARQIELAGEIARTFPPHCAGPYSAAGSDRSGRSQSRVRQVASGQNCQTGEDDAAAGEQFAGVVEDDDAVA